MREKKCKCSGDGYIFTTINGNSYCEECYCKHLELKERNFGERFVFKTLDNFQSNYPDNLFHNPSLIEGLKTIRANINKSMWICGEVELGKTHLLAGIYDELWAKGNAVRFMKENKFIESVIREDFCLNNRSVQTYLLDEIGKSKIDDWNLHKVFFGVDTIYSTKKQVIVASNWKPEQLTDKWGMPAMRRFNEECLLIEIKRGENG